MTTELQVFGGPMSLHLTYYGVPRDILAQDAIPLALSTTPAGAFHAEAVFAPLVDGSVIEAEIVSPVFYDPKGDRQNV